MSDKRWAEESAVNRMRHYVRMADMGDESGNDQFKTVAEFAFACDVCLESNWDIVPADLELREVILIRNSVRKLSGQSLDAIRTAIAQRVNRRLAKHYGSLL